MLKTLPVISLRDMVVLPGEVVHCDAGRKKTLSAIQAAALEDGLAFFCMQKNAEDEDPDANGLYRTGTIGKLKQVFRIQGDGVHMLVTGIARAYVKNFTSVDPYIEAVLLDLGEVEGDIEEIEAIRRRVQDSFSQCARLSGKITIAQRKAIEEIADPGAYTDAVAAIFVIDPGYRQRLLEESNVKQRLLLLRSLLQSEIEILQLDEKIKRQLHENIEKNQKEHYMREKIRVIRKELGDDGEDETEAFRLRMAQKKLPREVADRLKKEIDRFAMLPSGSHEAPMTRAFIECVLDLPWIEQSKDNFNIERARKVLEKNHYGMQKVKERVLEYLAVQRLTGRPGGEILCFVGPPGVGKTSIVASVAEAMGRKFVRMSLGGVRDEAEIRGHRRTYIGAMPGRVIAAMRQAGTINPVLLFDEIDKLASDYRGDPAAAMLEVLDSAQNFAFKDHFLELPYDLSHAMLITTANDKSGIPRPLLDRMEVIEVQSYLAEEKLEIGKQHLMKKQLAAHGLTKANLRLPDEVMNAVIHGYTREAGVRELERVLGALCRKTAVDIVGGKRRVIITPQKLTEYLGQPRFYVDAARKRNEVGVVTGLAWTPVGGDTLSIEAITLPGKGKLQLTGSLGNVMQESAKAALTYVRAHAHAWGLRPESLNELNMHLHVPQGAVPKDGPSAGVAMASAMLSAFTNIPARADIAMTGEISLRGKVLPIGGVREKSLAALRVGILEIILPAENKKDIEDIPQSARDRLQFHFVEDLNEVFAIVLAQQKETTTTGLENGYLPTENPTPVGYQA